MGEVWYDTANFIRSNRVQTLPKCVENLLARSSLATLRDMCDAAPDLTSTPGQTPSVTETNGDKPIGTSVDGRSQLASFGLRKILSEVCGMLEAPRACPHYVMCVKPNLYGMRPIDGVVAFDAAIVERQLRSWDLVRLCRSLHDAKTKARSRHIFSQTPSLRFNGLHFQSTGPPSPDNPAQTLYAAHLHPDATDQSYAFHAYNSAAVDSLTSTKKKKKERSYTPMGHNGDPIALATPSTPNNDPITLATPSTPSHALPSERSAMVMSPSVVSTTLRQPHAFLEANSSWAVTPRKANEPEPDSDLEAYDTSAETAKDAGEQTRGPIPKPTETGTETKAETQLNTETSSPGSTPNAKANAALTEVIDQLFKKAERNGKHAVRRFQLVRTLASKPLVLLALGLPQGATRPEVKALVDTIDSSKGNVVTREEFDAFVRRLGDEKATITSNNLDLKPQSNASSDMNVKPEPINDVNPATIISANTSTYSNEHEAKVTPEVDAIMASAEQELHEAEEEFNEAGKIGQEEMPEPFKDLQHCAELADDCLAGINALARACL